MRIGKNERWILIEAAGRGREKMALYKWEVLEGHYRLQRSNKTHWAGVYFRAGSRRNSAAVSYHKAIKTLHAKGLITVFPARYPNTEYLTLTPAGRKLVKQSDRAWTRELNEEIRKLSVKVN